MQESRQASCACGAVTIAATGEPERINACSCLQCQSRSGSAFSYTAFYPDAAVTITGEIAMWQTKGFCPICGCHILNRPETLPGLAGIPVGAFRDPAFARPDRFFWSQNKHKWVTLPPDLPTIETM